jgi:cytochrome c biogenesis factor
MNKLILPSILLFFLFLQLCLSTLFHKRKEVLQQMVLVSQGFYNLGFWFCNYFFSNTNAGSKYDCIKALS